MTLSSSSSSSSWKQRQLNDFQNAKAQCLGKRDKSFAGRIDPKAVEICALINERDEFYTTSSCAGRCFLYRGPGIKASTSFVRFRISHDIIKDPARYFDLTTIETDPTGGGDPIRTIGQYDYQQQDKQQDNDLIESSNQQSNITTKEEQEIEMQNHQLGNDDDKTIWLRFEPFILHVACRSLSAASELMTAARPAFKNVGLTTWKDQNKYLVAIWGDEGLEMPLCTPSGTFLYSNGSNSDFSVPNWLAQMVNDRHYRNWNKIARFVQSVREMGQILELDGHANVENDNYNIDNYNNQGRLIPKSFDVIGDIAYIHSLPESNAKNTTSSSSQEDMDQQQKQIGEAIMSKNKAIKVVVIRTSTMVGTERAPGSDGLKVIAGAQRSPLITTHTEYGIKCVVDLNHTFFSPRMAQERLRICQQVARGERVLVLFAGICMDALQIAGRTEASEILAIELNDKAVECANRAHRMLQRNKAVKCAGAADRLQIIQGNVLDIVPTLEQNAYDRIVAPRPKEGALDGDLGSGDGGIVFLNCLLPHLKSNSGECHWYDFVADHEFPECSRTKTLLTKCCQDHGLSMDVLHVSHVGSVAMRQYRVCIDFKVQILE